MHLLLSVFAFLFFAGILYWKSLVSNNNSVTLFLTQQKKKLHAAQSVAAINNFVLFIFEMKKKQNRNEVSSISPLCIRMCLWSVSVSVAVQRLVKKMV